MYGHTRANLFYCMLFLHFIILIVYYLTLHYIDHVIFDYIIIGLITMIYTCMYIWPSAFFHSFQELLAHVQRLFFGRSSEACRRQGMRRRDCNRSRLVISYRICL